MVRALRNGIMLLTLLLVIIGGTGMVSVCQCHGEIFMGLCSCHEETASCGCPEESGGRERLPVPEASHYCSHQHLELDSLTIPLSSPLLPSPAVIWQELPEFHQWTQLVFIRKTAASPDPVPPDLLAGDGEVHDGFQLPLLI